MNRTSQELWIQLQSELQSLQKKCGNAYEESWKIVFDILNQLMPNFKLQDIESTLMMDISSISQKGHQEEYDEYIPLPKSKSSNVECDSSHSKTEFATESEQNEREAEESEVKTTDVGSSKTGSSEISKSGLVESSVASRFNFRPAKKFRPLAPLKPLSTLDSSSKVVLQTMDQNLQDELKHDRELQNLLSSSWENNPEYALIQKNSGCFLTNTKNGNYNAINIIAILADCWNDTDTPNLIPRVANLLKDREKLFQYTSQQAKAHLADDSLCLWVKDMPSIRMWIGILRNQDWLGRYCADLALFRLAISIRCHAMLPQTLILLAPKNILDLADSVKWVPSEPDKQKRALLKEYTSEQKALYVLQKLAENNPVEFDLKYQNFLK